MSPNIALIYRLLLTIVCCIAASWGVDIRRLSIPRWVHNGTSEGVVLDCDYVYNENDLRLVVKWFFNDDLEPLYQWIPELKVRHVSGLLYGRLDMDYSINPYDPYSQFRALRISSATPDLSGKYTCLVTSLAGQDSRHQDMTVYAPAYNFRFSSAMGNNRQLNFTCIAEGVYPEPRMKLFVVSKKQNTQGLKQKPSPTDMAVAVIRQKPNSSAFDATVTQSMDQQQLVASSTGGVTVLECLLEIPGSPYRKIKRITYYSGARGQQWTSTGITTRPTIICVLLLIVSAHLSRHYQSFSDSVRLGSTLTQSLNSE